MTRSGFEYVLAKHIATAARKEPSIEVRQQASLLQGLAADNAEHKRSPAGARQNRLIATRLSPISRLSTLCRTPVLGSMQHPEMRSKQTAPRSRPRGCGFVEIAHADP